MRGYVSFIAFSLLSLLILLPFLIHPYQQPSLAPAYSNERLYYSSTAFIRAAADAASDSVADIEKARLALEAAGIPVPQDDREIAKQAVVLRWGQLLLQWNNDQNLGSKAEIICGMGAQSASLHSPPAALQPTPAALQPPPAAPQPSLSACTDYLEYSPSKIPGTPGTVSIAASLPSDGIFIKISDSRSGASATTRMPGNFALNERG